jgi:hypothetical protein
MVRQIMIDLENGNFCKKEVASKDNIIYLAEKNFKVKDSIISDLNITVSNLNAKVNQKDTLIKLTEKERDIALSDKKKNLYKGAGIGFLFSLFFLLL